MASNFVSIMQYHDDTVKQFAKKLYIQLIENAI